MINYPKTAEYRQVTDNNWPIADETIHGEFYSTDFRITVRLISRVAGYRIASSAMIYVNAAWGCLTEDRNSTRGGQWFKTEQEAREEYQRRYVSNQVR